MEIHGVGHANQGRVYERAGLILNVYVGSKRMMLCTIDPELMAQLQSMDGEEITIASRLLPVNSTRPADTDTIAMPICGDDL